MLELMLFHIFISDLKGEVTRKLATSGPTSIPRYQGEMSMA